MRTHNLFLYATARWAVLSVIILCGFLFSILSVHAVEYGQLGAKPGNPDPNVDNSESWFIYSSEPGTSVQDTVIVSNNSDAPVDALVYAADTTKSSSGGFALKQYSEPKEHVGTWVRFYPEEIPEQYQALFEKNEQDIVKTCGFTRSDESTSESQDEDEGSDKDSDGDEQTQDEKESVDTTEKVSAAKEESIDDDGLIDTKALEEWCKGVESIERSFEAKEALRIPFVFSVPDGTDVGEHTGGILIQKKFAEEESAGSGVKLTTRIGVRIYETVPGEIIKTMSLEDFSIEQTYNPYDIFSLFGSEKTEPTYTVTTIVKNDGNVSIEHNNDLLIDDGKSEPKREERTFQALKGDTFTANYQWTAPGNGSYRFSPEIVYEDAHGNQQVIVGEGIDVNVMPTREILLGMIIAVIIGLTILIVWLVRKKKYGGKNWVEHEVQVGENITILAQQYGVDWKVLAKTNHIKAPYFLTPGDVITVPQSTKTSKSAEKEKGPSNSKVTKGGTGAVVTPQSDEASPFQEDMEMATDFTSEENEAEEQAAQRAKEKPSIAALAMEMQMKHADKGDNMAFSDTKKKMDVSWMKEDEKQYEADVQPEKKRQKALMWKFVIWSIVVIVIVALAINLLSRMQTTGEKEAVSITNVVQQDEEDGSMDSAEDTQDSSNDDQNESNEQATEETIVEGNQIDAKDVTVTVLNGGAAAGEAGKLTTAIGEKEYDMQAATNAKDEIDGNIVYYSEDDHKTAAEDIVIILEGEALTPVKAEKDEKITNGFDSNIVVIIGA